jgi:hypothetical protein
VQAVGVGEANQASAPPPQILGKKPKLKENKIMKGVYK